MIENRTPWAVATLGISDRHGEPALCIVIEATVGLNGTTCEQPPVCLDGVWDGDPASSAPREAPCCCMPKAGTDCLLRGHGYARFIRFRCGPVQQQARLSGARTWVRRWFGIKPAPEAAFEPVPLIWEQAAGAQPANPVGVGVVKRTDPFRDGVSLPRIEHPAHSLTRWGCSPKPVGFGPTTPAWAHRRGLDAYDPDAQHIAPPELITPTLRGDEELIVEGCRQPIACQLPGLPPPRVRLVRRRGDLQPQARLDTVLVDADALTMRLSWRTWCLVGEHAEVEMIEVA